MFNLNLITNELLQSFQLTIISPYTSTLQNKNTNTTQSYYTNEVGNPIECIYSLSWDLLPSLQHLNLSRYLQISEINHQIILISEKYSTLNKKDIGSMKKEQIVNEVLDGLIYLHRNGIIHGNLSLETIQYDVGSERIKLSGFGIWSVSNYGRWFQPPVLEHPAPEYFWEEFVMTEKFDIWSFGLLLYELLTKETLFSSSSGSTEGSTEESTEGSSKSSGLDYEKIVSSPEGQKLINERLEQKIKETTWLEVLKNSLVLDPSQRYSALQLKSLLTTNTTATTTSTTTNNNTNTTSTTTTNVFSGLTSDQVYELWKLSGKSLTKELTKGNKSAIPSLSPIFTSLPQIIQADGTEIYTELMMSSSGSSLNQGVKYQEISLLPLIERLSNIKEELKEEPKEGIEKPEGLGLTLRSRDLDYQYRSLKYLNSLLKQFPFSKDRILSELRNGLIDVPKPLVYPIWYILLSDIHQQSTNTITTPTTSILNTSAGVIDDDPVLEKQLEVDLPRCHPYHPLIGSLKGRRTIRVFIHSFLKTHQGFVYWQGLDSLTTPFVISTFKQTHTTINHSLEMFYQMIQFYFQNFFRMDNSLILKERLSLLDRLLEMFDRDLWQYLKDIGFGMDIFCIGWLLTGFAHTLPIQKTIELWTQILLQNHPHPLFPLFIALGYLTTPQVRQGLMKSEFGECMQYVSGGVLSGIEVEGVVEKAKEFINRAMEMNLLPL